MTTKQPEIPTGSSFGEKLASMLRLRGCATDLNQTISARLGRMFQIFKQLCGNPGNNAYTSDDEYINTWSQSVTLYKKLLEAILRQEQKRGFCVQSAIKNDTFQRSLVLFCLEMVTCKQHPTGSFPLLAQAFNLAPYHFYKVIELVLRTQENPSPWVVKHFSHLEVAVLVSLAWTEDSPLWDSIRDLQGRLPNCQQVMGPRYFDDPDRLDVGQDQTSSQLRRRNRPTGSFGVLDRGLGAPLQPNNSLPSVGTSQITSSLSLFLRKVYCLMSARLQRMCHALGISDLCEKIWTCFEYSLVHYSQMMRDRHLDQLLICAIYIICRITNGDMKLMSIMECNENQFHTKIGRDVLICGNSPGGGNREIGSRGRCGTFLTPDTPSSHSPSPGMTASSKTERAQLISFYNDVYLNYMEKFVQDHFSPTAVALTPPLTPLPRPPKGSPRRQRPFRNLPLSVSLLDPPASLRKGLTYCFSRDSSTALHKINTMIRTRMLPAREEEELAPLMKRRRTQCQSVVAARASALVKERAQHRPL